MGGPLGALLWARRRSWFIKALSTSRTWNLLQPSVRGTSVSERHVPVAVSEEKPLTSSRSMEFLCLRSRGH